MAKTRKYDPPATSIGDHGHTLARAVAGSLPYVGSAAVELFGALIAPPMQRRQREWMEQVGEGLRQLEENRGVNIDELGKDEGFIDTVLHASQAAMRTSEQEKREALRNAVLNSALPNAPDESKRQLFINWLDTLTVWHLRLLRLFADPVKWFQDHQRQPPQFAISSNLERLMLDAYPELNGKRAFYDKVVADLGQQSLGPGSVHGMMSAGGAFDKRGTELGNELLAFLTAPKLD